MSGFIAVHTGAGNKVGSKNYKKVIKQACINAKGILSKGGSALDACESAIITLEDSGNTNAGNGSNLTWDGTIECDASIMDSRNMEFGACTNVSNLKNPIKLARKICEAQSKPLLYGRIPPMVMSGLGAMDFAQKAGLEIIDSEQLKSKKALKIYQFYKEKISNFECIKNIHISPLDTVGAICVDSSGNCAAGCSSGGLILKLSGRIGQAATYGAGCWAERNETKSIATCTTGNGEYIMKTLLAREIVNSLLPSGDPTPVLHETFKRKFLESPMISSKGKLYAGALTLIYHPLEMEGELLWCHSTNNLCLGYMTTEKATPTFLRSDLTEAAESGQSVSVGGQFFKFNL